ncbi:MAG: flagellar type III secretion system pore protein FliP [Deltaproteobacteria bacterium]|jgi:flagellar biosynthetic protein FliP|nr:flagellar type III secretion system pore protein FliP [Deltaproteobacteria bacterium]
MSYQERISNFSGLNKLAQAQVAGLGLLLLTLALPALSFAQTTAPIISVNLPAADTAANGQVMTALKIVGLITSLVFLPALLMCTTCFTRIAIVLAMTRQALGTAQTPPNQVLLGIALFLTIAIMGPAFEKIYNNSLVPYSEDQITTTEALERAFAPVRDFMLSHTREQDLTLFMEVLKVTPPNSPQELGPSVIVPAFLLSELNTAYQIAFLIFLPFLILDLIISSILTSMSMITLPPTIISLPIKLMLFVIIDGWHLIIGNLVKSYGG